MSRFLFNLFLFFTPLTFIWIFPLYVYWEGHEFVSIDRVIETQRGSKQLLFGLAYSNVDRAYKIRLTADRKPSIIALGNSRVMEVRKEFFHEPENFINAGGAASSLQDAVLFVDALPKDNLPRVLILGVYPGYFQPQKSGIVDEGTLAFRLRSFFAVRWRQVYIDYFTGKFTLSQLSLSKNSYFVGLNALISREGYLNDGSYYYGKVVNDPLRVSNLETAEEIGVSNINKRTRGSVNDPVLPEENFRALEILLELCKDNNVHVVGFIPPDRYAVSRKVISPYMQLVSSIAPRARDIFGRFGFSLFDYTGSYTAGVEGTEFIDADHPSDKATLRLLIDMTMHDDILAGHVHISHLRSLLTKTKGDFVITDAEIQ